MWEANVIRKLVRSAAFGLVVAGVSLAANFVADMGIAVGWAFLFAAFGYHAGLEDGEKE